MKHIKAVAVLAALAVLSVDASAQTFSAGMPAGWTCLGNCGTLGANGVVSLAPGGGTQYGWVSTENGVGGTNTLGLTNATNGTNLRSNVFSANANDLLEFDFNYVASDGQQYADFAWARLLDASLNQVAILFTARTQTSGNIVPGAGMPAIDAGVTMVPATSAIIPGGPAWSPLGGSSGACYGAGCGYTGWIEANYTVVNAGLYVLEFGVMNYLDTLYQAGLAIDGARIGGADIGVPEPASIVLLATGLLGIAGFARRRKA